MNKNQKGFGGLIMLLVVLVILLVVGYLFTEKTNNDVSVIDKVEKVKEMIEEQGDSVEFGETNDELIKELDSIMDEIEDSAESSDLSELE